MVQLKEDEMKTELFTAAIKNRYRLRFLYDMEEITLEPYYLAKNKAGKKVLFGRVNNSLEVAMFDYKRIANIKTMSDSKFYPIIPILPIAS
jgi:hypothetical protein